MPTIGKIMNEAGMPVCHMFYSVARRRSGEYRNHKHTEFEISMIEEGRGIYHTSTGDVEIEAGDILLFSTNEPHCITDISTPTMRILNLHVQPSFAWNTGNSYLGNGYLKVFFSRGEGVSNRLPRNHPATASLIALLNGIKAEFEGEKTDKEVAIKIGILQTMILIRREYGITEEREETFLSAPDYARIERAINFMDKNFTQNISLEEIAEESSLSRSYFCTVFRRLNGLTPWDYINIRRINRAMELLKTTDMTVLDVALACGYNNTTNFNRIFRGVTGQTPKQYRANKKPNGAQEENSDVQEGSCMP